MTNTDTESRDREYLNPTLEEKAEQEARWRRTLEKVERKVFPLREPIQEAMVLYEEAQESPTDEQPATGGATTAIATRATGWIVPSVTLPEVADRIEDATLQDVGKALKVVMAAMGRDMDEDRVKTVALLILDQGWKRAELMEAARYLANDPELRDGIRYGGTITPADFEAVRQGKERKVKYENGDLESVLSLTGKAKEIRSKRLYSYAEAFGLWQRMGQPGVFSDSKEKKYAKSLFTVVDVEGTIYWQMK